MRFPVELHINQGVDRWLTIAEWPVKDQKIFPGVFPGRKRQFFVIFQHFPGAFPGQFRSEPGEMA